MGSEIVVSVELECSANRAWECWTRPESIVRWNHASEDWRCPSAVDDLRVDRCRFLQDGRRSWTTTRRSRKPNSPPLGQLEAGASLAHRGEGPLLLVPQLEVDQALVEAHRMVEFGGGIVAEGYGGPDPRAASTLHPIPMGRD